MINTEHGIGYELAGILSRRHRIVVEDVEQRGVAERRARVRHDDAHVVLVARARLEHDHELAR